MHQTSARIILKNSLLGALLCSVAACVQAPAQVVLKGQNDYSGGNPTKLASVSHLKRGGMVKRVTPAAAPAQQDYAAAPVPQRQPEYRPAQYAQAQEDYRQPVHYRQPAVRVSQETHRTAELSGVESRDVASPYGESYTQAAYAPAAYEQPSYAQPSPRAAMTPPQEGYAIAGASTAASAPYTSVHAANLGDPGAPVMQQAMQAPIAQEPPAVSRPVNLWSGEERAPVQSPASHDGVSQTVASAARVDYNWPVESRRVVDSFGPKSGGRVNNGINIASAEGEPVRAAADGEVVFVGDELKGYGNMVMVRHADGKTTTYAHLSQASADKYTLVRQGEIIGYSGKTGHVRNPQLYFAINDGRHALNPQQFLTQRMASLSDLML